MAAGTLVRNAAAVPRLVPGGSSACNRLTDRQLLEAIHARLVSVEAAVERLTPPGPRLHRDDLRLLQRLLPELWSRYEDAAFTAGDLCADAQVRPLFGDASPKAIGKTLARLAGVPSSGGLFLERRRGRSGHLWSVTNPAAVMVSALSGGFKGA